MLSLLSTVTPVGKGRVRNCCVDRHLVKVILVLWWLICLLFIFPADKLFTLEHIFGVAVNPYSPTNRWHLSFMFLSNKQKALLVGCISTVAFHNLPSFPCFYRSILQEAKQTLKHQPLESLGYWRLHLWGKKYKAVAHPNSFPQYVFC